MNNPVIFYTSTIVFCLAVFFGLLKLLIKKRGNAERRLHVCTECLTSGYKLKVVKGSWIVKVILFMCGIIPGIAYASWQESTTKYVCPGCKKDAMIPSDTPRGVLLLKGAGPE